MQVQACTQTLIKCLFIFLQHLLLHLSSLSSVLCSSRACFPFMCASWLCQLCPSSTVWCWISVCDYRCMGKSFRVASQKSALQLSETSLRPGRMRSWPAWDEAELQFNCPLCCCRDDTRQELRDQAYTCTKKVKQTKNHRPTDSSTSAHLFVFLSAPCLRIPYNDPEMRWLYFPFSCFNSITLSAVSLTFLHSPSIKEPWKPRLWFHTPFYLLDSLKSDPSPRRSSLSPTGVTLIPTSLPVSLSPLQVWPNSLQFPLHFLTRSVFSHERLPATLSSPPFQCFLLGAPSPSLLAPGDSLDNRWSHWFWGSSFHLPEMQDCSITLGYNVTKQ